MFVGVEQPANFREEGGLDSASVNVVTKGLHVRSEVFVELFWGAVVCDQNTDEHPVCDALGAKALEVFTYCCVRLSNLIWFGQYLFVDSEVGFEGEEDCGLINSVDGCKKFGEVKALDCHCF